MATNTVTTEQVREAIEQFAAMAAAASISPQTVANILEMLRNLNDQERLKIIEVIDAYIAQIQSMGIEADQVYFNSGGSVEEVIFGSADEEIELLAANDVRRRIAQTSSSSPYVWTQQSACKHQCIPCVGGNRFIITANGIKGYNYCFLKSYDAQSVDSDTPAPEIDWAFGYDAPVYRNYNSETEVVAPSDARWLYIETVDAQGECRPSSITREGVGGLVDAVHNKVDKIAGKGLSKNDYTDADKGKVSTIDTLTASLASLIQNYTDINAEVNGSAAGEIDLSQLPLGTRFIVDGEWKGLNSNGHHYCIPCMPGERFTIVASSQQGRYCFLKSYDAEAVATETPAPAVDFATGYTDAANISASATKTVEAPSDAKYLYIGTTYNQSDFTPSRVDTLGYPSLSDSINELASNLNNLLLDVDGTALVDPINKYIVYDDGSIYQGWTAGGYWFKNIGYKKVVAKLGWNNTTYAAIAFFNSEVASPDSYMKSASVQHKGSASDVYEADVPEGCKMICISNRNNSLANPEISLYYSGKEVINTMLESTTLPSIKDIEGLMDSNGFLVESTAFSIKNSGNCNPIIITCRAKYIGNTAPTIQYSVGLFNSKPYDLGGKEESIIQQWRIPPIIGTMPNATITITIPSGTQLKIDAFTTEYCGNVPKDGVTRINSHLGFLAYAPEQTLASIEAAAIMGYKRCIVNPIRTSDGVWMCYHGGKAYLSPDGTKANAIAIADADFANYTFAQIRAYEVVTSDAMHAYWPDCKVPTLDEVFALMARTGLQPIFSVHPTPNASEWGEIKALLTKYELLDKLTIKIFSVADFIAAKAIFGNAIESYIVITYQSTLSDVEAVCDSFNNNKGDITVRLGVELGTSSTYTAEFISAVINKGFFPTVESYSNNVASGAAFKQLMAYGATDFTDDINPNCGLNW